MMRNLFGKVLKIIVAVILVVGEPPACKYYHGPAACPLPPEVEP